MTDASRHALRVAGIVVFIALAYLLLVTALERQPRYLYEATDGWRVVSPARPEGIDLSDDGHRDEEAVATNPKYPSPYGRAGRTTAYDYSGSKSYQRYAFRCTDGRERPFWFVRQLPSRIRLSPGSGVVIRILSATLLHVLAAVIAVLPHRARPRDAR